MSVLTNVATRSRSRPLELSSKQSKLIQKEFSKFYPDLCQQQHTHPLQSARRHLDHRTLEIYGDRINFDDWLPLVSAISCDETLNKIAIHLKEPYSYVIETADTEQKARNTRKYPAIITKFLLHWAVEGIKQCLLQSPSLTVLELTGLPLRGLFIDYLAEGLNKARNLQYLSLSKSTIGDAGVEALCLALRDSVSLISLDLSYCELTKVGSAALAKLIIHQKLRRYTETWRQTLRYRDTDLEAMSGLRRITLNHNPDMGDDGVRLIAEELQDDLWIRALDLQKTGLTAEGGNILLDIVLDNPNLMIVDVRDNENLSEEILSQIMSQLAEKHQGEYKWIDIESSKIKECVKKAPRCNNKENHIKLVTNPSLTFCSSVRGMPSFRRSKSSLTRNDIQANKKPEQKIELQTEVENLKLLLNFEIKQKNVILKENYVLKNKLEKCELEKRELVAEFEKKNLVTEETLTLLEKTLGHFSKLLLKDNLMKEEIPDVMENLQLLLANNIQRKGRTHHKRKTKRRKIQSEVKTMPDVKFRNEKDDKLNKARAIFAQILKEKEQLRTREQQAIMSSTSVKLSNSSEES